LGPVFLLIFLALTWGSSFILIKKGLEAYNPKQLISLRLSIAGLMFLPYFLRSIKSIGKKDLGSLLFIGLFGSMIPFYLFAVAQTKIDSSIAGTLNSMTPIFALIFGVIIFKFKFGKKTNLGVIIGFIGALILILFGVESINLNHVWYGALILLSTIFYALSGNLVKAKLSHVKAYDISAFTFSMILPIALVILIQSNFFEVFQTHPKAVSSFGFIFLLAVFGTVIATILYFQLVHLTNPVFASLVSFLMPIIAILWGVLDGERITMIHLLGLMLILGGVYLTRMDKTT
jgi:drug/metabolite transporter (DMT)-like permease